MESKSIRTPDELKKQRKIGCENEIYGCKETSFFFDDIVMHEKICSFVKVSCTYCKSEMFRSQIETHELNCDERTFQCKDCSFVGKINTKHCHNTVEYLSNKLKEEKQLLEENEKKNYNTIVDMLVQQHQAQSKEIEALKVELLKLQKQSNNISNNNYGVNYEVFDKSNFNETKIDSQICNNINSYHLLNNLINKKNKNELDGEINFVSIIFKI